MMIPAKKNSTSKIKAAGYTVNISADTLLDSYVNKWVLEWCRKYYPSAFEEAIQFIEEYLKEAHNYNSIEEFKAGWRRGSASGS